MKLPGLASCLLHLPLRNLTVPDADQTHFELPIRRAEMDHVKVLLAGLGVVVGVIEPGFSCHTLLGSCVLWFRLFRPLT